MSMCSCLGARPGRHDGGRHGEASESRDGKSYSTGSSVDSS
jgi:hypothetical protein